MKKMSIFVACLGLAITVGACSSRSDAESPASLNAKLVVYKSPTCGCCEKWIEHMKDAGFEVEAHDVQDMKEVKSALGINDRFSSCHTALVDGYVIEGHVPADQVKRLLAEKPDFRGLAVPRMPPGSPGMELENTSLHQDYDVLTFDHEGRTTVYHHVEANTGS